MQSVAVALSVAVSMDVDVAGEGLRWVIELGNRIFTVVVLVLWAASMSWLVADRVLPPLFYGKPPSSGLLHQHQPVGWKITCDGNRVGMAVSQVVPGTMGTTELHTCVLLKDMPLKEMAPRWMANIVERVGPLELDVRSRVTLDTLDRLASFVTTVRLNGLPAVIKMKGNVEDSLLKVRIQTGDAVHLADYPVPKTSLLAGDLTPDAKLLQAYVGRKWQKEVYSPFRTPGSNVEIIQAEVVCEEQLLHNTQLRTLKRVEYRALSSTGVSDHGSLRAVLWVAQDGTVLRQDVQLINVRLRFDRLEDDASLGQAKELLNLKKYATLSGKEF